MTSPALDPSSADALAAELIGLNWSENSSQVFAVLKTLYGLEGQGAWEFSIDSPDPDPAELLDPAGSAAFVLRRIQALRFQVRNLQNAPADLMYSHAVEVRQFLVNLVSSGKFADEGMHSRFAVILIRRYVDSLEHIAFACASG